MRVGRISLGPIHYVIITSALLVVFGIGVTAGYWVMPRIVALFNSASSDNQSNSTPDNLPAVPLDQSGSPQSQSSALGGSNTSSGSGSSSSSPPPSTPQFQEVALSGHGQQATKLITLPAGGYRVSMTHDGTSNFIVILDDSQGKQIAVMANQVGKANVSQVVNVAAGGYVFNVGADGNWTIKVDSIQ